MFWTICTVLAFTLLLLPQQPPQPAPDERQAPEKGKTQSGTKEHETQRPQPDPSKTIPAGLQPVSEITQPQASQSKTDEKRQAPIQEKERNPDWWMIGLTGGLVLVGGLQAAVLWRQTGIVGEYVSLTAKLADLSNRSLILTQRPQLKVRRLILDEPSYDSRFMGRKLEDELAEPLFKLGEPIKGQLLVVNSGNGRARVRESCCRVLNAGEPERLPLVLPREPNETKTDHTLVRPVGRWIEPGEIIPCHFAGIGPSLDQIKETERPGAERLNLYVLGWIEYEDELQFVRRTAFCRRYHSGFHRFVRVDDPDQEYAH